VRRVILVGLSLVAGITAAFRNYADSDRPWSPAAAQAEERSGELVAAIRAVEARACVKEETAAALVRGEVSADEAEATFRRLLESDPLVWDSRDDGPWATDREFVLRNLVVFVHRYEGTDPERAAKVLGRLEAAITRELMAV
jgi:hypothetical protein